MGSSHSSYSPPPLPNTATYAFIDGTNLFKAIRDANLKLPQLRRLLTDTRDSSHKLIRIYVYTTIEKAKRELNEHGPDVFEGCRLVYGVTVTGGSGNVREKGVDAQLTADMVYHAASRNAAHIVLISNDSDFQFALRRTEDFGCTTEVISVIAETCDALKLACDRCQTLEISDLIKTFGVTSA
jgi:uncharacterized LabA/DUF88 family protein